ncbi:DUF2946 domain-containing protein [Paraburkholderia tropica]|uniref:DUF2946 domain-containing protein n=1 Tax=Paraburkholderia tropica TaxID=92647 RepID=UPI002AB6FCFC|nr:DUF2946 domain-containing protein [Paraburkholderia tropica]
MNAHTRTFTTAWLGLIAMCLLVLAPIVSQLVVAHREGQPVGELCSASAGVAARHAGEGLSLDACDYCGLLASHPAMPSIPAVALHLIAVTQSATLLPMTVRFTPHGAFPSGRPRAPPSFG